MPFGASKDRTRATPHSRRTIRYASAMLSARRAERLWNLIWYFIFVSCLSPSQSRGPDDGKTIADGPGVVYRIRHRFGAHRPSGQPGSPRHGQRRPGDRQQPAFGWQHRVAPSANHWQPARQAASLPASNAVIASRLNPPGPGAIGAPEAALGPPLGLIMRASTRKFTRRGRSGSGCRTRGCRQ